MIPKTKEKESEDAQIKFKEIISVRSMDVESRMEQKGPWRSI
jgi:hypothetical protein